MTIVWPKQTLGDLQLVGTKLERQSGVIRSRMEVGPDKVRRRTTAVVDRMNIPVEFDGVQFAAFREFFRYTLLEGSLPFEWTDPVTDETARFRFVAPPSIVLAIGSLEPEDRRYAGTLELERLPDA